MATVRDQPADNQKKPTRTRILDAAADVFATKGYHTALVDDIAQTAGASKGAIYFHFPSKQDIFLALVARLGDTLLSSTQEAIEQEKGGVAKIDAALTAVIETLSRHRALAKILLVSGAGLGRPFDDHLLAVLDKFAAVIKANLDRAVANDSIAPVDTTIVAYAWLGAVHEVVTRWLLTGVPDPLESALPTLRSVLLGSIGLTVEDITQDNLPSSSLPAKSRFSSGSSTKSGQSGGGEGETTPHPNLPPQGGKGSEQGQARPSPYPSPAAGEGTGVSERRP